MAKQFDYEVKTTIRLNMHNPDHVLINNVIQNLDPKIFKSKNQFILDACKFYIDNYGSETFIARKKDNERAEYIRSADIEDIKAEVIEAATNEARKEVIKLLGGVISGMNVGQPVIMQAPRTARTRKFNANLARFFNIIIPRTSTQLPAMIQNDVSDISCMAFSPRFFLYL